ncbi:hypothetical protein [Flavobacterium sp.]|uniref:hypothetical protein n=1 Tax=Flavobacterium sp. TaxID=239 RepID=UPI004033E044
MAKSFLPDPKNSHDPKRNYPRGIRNNNPGNLRRSANAWVGKIPYTNSTDVSFEQFTHLHFGIRAMMRDIISDIKKGNDTIAGLIAEYAPPSENNTANYIQSVATALGVDVNMKLEVTDQLLITIAKAIALKENGPIAKQLISDSDYQDAIDIIGVPIKKKAPAALPQQ